MKKLKLNLLLVLAILMGIFLMFRNDSLGNVQTTELDSVIPKSTILLEKTPKEIVIEYCELSRSQTNADLTDLITSIPKTYKDYLENKVKLNQKDEKLEKQSIPANTHTLKQSELVGSNLAYALIKESYPEEIRQLKFKVLEVLDEKIKDNDSRVQVKFQSENNKSVTFEDIFFLHRESGKWKIFLVSASYTNESFPE